ncbi:universal stress protein [Haloprofundus salilacus]|uniref:universal stress protein n=1 Tax=Haloprofundus salilacus TaxID=2876190 RepID=UPI001CCBDBCC|nr:universal stress protein [Haloprofundus salilacus]
MYDTILVPTDGSEAAMRALDHALLLARATDASVHALYVANSEPDETSIPPDENETRQYRDVLRRHGEGVLDSVGERVESIPVETESSVEIESPATNLETALRTGVPHEAILSYADEQRVDLVVMGTHGRSGLRRYLLGSVAERVVRLADCPVMTVHEDDDAPSSYQRVLVPTDGSDCAEAAAEHAVAVARAFDAEIHALSVVNLAEEGGLFSAGGIDSAFVERLDESARADADAVVERAREASVRGESTVVHGVPHEEIGEYATANDVDLVVMGTHGRSGFRRYLLGSVTERVLRTGSTPVLAVRQQSDR